MAEQFQKLTYHRKLVLVFALIAVVIVIISLTSACFVSAYLSARNDRTLESLEELSVYMAKNTVTEISTIVTYLSTYSNLLNWVASEKDSAEYYYNSLLVYQELGRRSPSYTVGNYSIALTRSGDDSFVITPGGTLSKDNYAKSIGLEDASDLPTQNGVKLAGENLILAVNRYLGGRTLTFYCTIPVQLLFPSPDKDIYHAIIDMNTMTIYSNNSTLEALLADIPIEDGRFQVDGWSMRIEFLSYFQLALVSAHPKSNNFILLLAILIPLFIAIVSILAYKVQKMLYRPVKIAYESLKDDENETEDEFDAIISKCRQVEAISQQLEDLSADLQNATDVIKYRSYIMGMESMTQGEDDDVAYFTVAAITPLVDDEERLVHFHLSIRSMAWKVEHLHYVITDSKEGVLIYKAEDEEESWGTLYKFLSTSAVQGTECEMQAAISHTVQGWKEIEAAYHKSIDILDCRYLARDKIILTEADEIANPIQMRYPISEERRLINSALSASEDTLAIFDSIVSTNESAYGPLSSALCGTVTRILQELRMDTGEVPDWRETANPEHTIATLRGILERIVNNQKRQTDAKSILLVEKMKDYIREHYNEPLMLIDLSTQFNLSPKYCSEIFNRVSGDTFKNYLNQYRVNMAVKILDEKPSVKITALASMVGFASSNTFIRVFEKYMGLTPGQYAEHRMKK